jgi:hypothetical protein
MHVYYEGYISDHIVIIIDGEFEVYKRMPKNLDESLKKNGIVASYEQSGINSVRSIKNSALGGRLGGGGLPESNSSIKFSIAKKKSPQFISITILGSKQVSGEVDAYLERPYTNSIRCASFTGKAYVIKAS